MNKLDLHNIATSKKIEINSGPRKPIDNNCLFELLVHTGFLFKNKSENLMEEKIQNLAKVKANQNS